MPRFSSRASAHPLRPSGAARPLVAASLAVALASGPFTTPARRDPAASALARKRFSDTDLDAIFSDDMASDAPTTQIDASTAIAWRAGATAPSQH